MRVACLSVHSSPLGRIGGKDTGGMSIYLRETARALGKLGCRVDLFTRDDGSANEPVVEVAPGVRLVHLNAGPANLGKSELYPYLGEFALKLERFRRERRLHYDLVYSHYWLSGCAGRLLQVKWAAPHLLMFHTLGAVKNAASAGENEPALRIEAEKVLARECDGIIVAAVREKSALVRHYGAAPAKIRVVPCGVDPALFRILERRGARERLGLGEGAIILFVGRIEPVKGLDLLIEALGRMPEGMDCKLLVAGGDESSSAAVERLKAAAGRCGAGDKVIFTGSIPHEQLPLYYNAADVTAVTSHYESFGLVALESLACGTPVVATDVGDLKDIIRQGETGYVLGGRSPDELASGLALCISGNSLRRPREVRDSVAHLDWASVARQLAAAFAELGSCPLLYSVRSRI